MLQNRVCAPKSALQLTAAFCAAYCKHVRQRNCGWFDKLTSREQVASCRDISKYLLPYESFFGQDGRKKSNKQMRVDSIGAQVIASNYRTFHTVDKYNKLAC